MVICLERGADLHMAQLMPLPPNVSASVKSRLVLPFWYRLTRVVPEKGPLNGCMYGMYGYLLFENCLHDGLSLEHCLLKTLHTVFQMNADLPVAAYSREVTGAVFCVAVCTFLCHPGKLLPFF